MIFNVITLLIGLMLLIAGIYYVTKEKDDAESRKIYLIVTVIGVILIAFAGIRMFL